VTALSRLTLTAAAMLALSGAAWGQSSLPRCGGSAGPALPSDCVLEAPPLMLGFDFTPMADDPQRGVLTLTQSTPEGGTRDVSGPFEIAGGLSPPALRDIDGDAVPELFVQSRPTAFDIWTLDAEGFYRSAGRISAQSPEMIEERGALIVGAVREADGLITETAYLLDGAEVVTVFRLRLDPATRTCSLIAGDAEALDWLNTDVLIAECAERDWGE
jgi:hypothetical protein